MSRGYDYLVVGAGFAGAVLAERLARAAGKRVLLIDRRDHFAGNAHDYYDAHGVLIHKYGPHIFHTNSDVVFEYLSRFTAWHAYEHRVLSMVDGQLVPVPINLDTINAIYGLALTEAEAEEFLRSVAEPVGEVRTSEDIIVSRVGRLLFEKMFRGYTRKQWGLEPRELDATVAGRIPFRTNREARYFTDRHQAMPARGYTALFEAMLDHPDIDIELGVSYEEARRMAHRELIFCGPVDEFFGHALGRLPYRSLRFEFDTAEGGLRQPTGTINYPNDHAYTRTTEFKHLTGQASAYSTICTEYPQAEGDPYYPIPRPDNAALYQRYAELARATPGVHFVGRLGTYRYYNMDQVVAQALTLFERLTGLPALTGLAEPAAAPAAG